MASMRLLIVPLCFIAALAPAQSERFESVSTTSADGVPGAYVYDPLTGESQKNERSAVLGGDAIPLAANITGSTTIEFFFKPGEIATESPLIHKGRRSPAAAELGLGTVRVNGSPQIWCGAYVTEPGQEAVEKWHAGHDSSSACLLPANPAWRHLALVYDAASATVTCWVDYHLGAIRHLKNPLTFDDGPLTLGGGGMSGWIDEVRISPKALVPGEFLRARKDSLSGVKFPLDTEVLPPDSGALDVRFHFGAVGDGKADDTDALNAAFAHLADKGPLEYNTLILPAGTYLISGRLHSRRFIDILGAGPDKTFLKLKDGTFKDIDNPQPVLRIGSAAPDEPGSAPVAGDPSMGLYLTGVTIDTGKDNPGAKGLEYHSNHRGRLENVIIRSGDGQGAIGLDLTPKAHGPALIKHVTIQGFEQGIATRHQENSVTLEDITLSGQMEAGIYNEGNILAMRRLRSVNVVPAILSKGESSMVTLIDAELSGGSAEQEAVQAEGGLYQLRVKVQDYKDQGEIEEKVAGTVIHGHGAATGALKLPIEDTPEPSFVPPSEWVSVTTFSDQNTEDDWGPAIQAAIDSGPRVLYFPRGVKYLCKTPVYIHGVERIVGMANAVQWHPSVWVAGKPRDQTDLESAPAPLMIFDEPDARKTVWLDRLDVATLHHASPATLVLRSSTPLRYTNAEGCGRLFLEDVGGADWRFEQAQQVWVRQWNPGSHESGPCVFSQGATIWCLGFQAGYESSKLWATAGAQTEVLGAFIHPTGKVPTDRPIFKNEDSRMALVYGIRVGPPNHPVHMIDRKDGNTRTIGSDALKPTGSRYRMDLFVTE